MARVILIGDSIRMGYLPVVRAAMTEAEVWGPSDNCETSRKILAHLPEWVLEQTPDIIHFNCGLHDLRRLFDPPAETQVPLDEYSRNIDAIITTIKRYTAAQMIWATTTPVNEVNHHRNKPFDRFEADVRAFNAAARAVADHHGLPVNDLYATVMAAGRDRLLVADGVHYTDEGSRILGAAVVHCLRTYLPAEVQAP